MKQAVQIAKAAFAAHKNGLSGTGIVLDQDGKSYIWQGTSSGILWFVRLDLNGKMISAFKA